jgi:hypothetical protein
MAQSADAAHALALLRARREMTKTAIGRSVAAVSERPDPPLSNRRVGTCHDATGVARHDRHDSYKKTERLAA